MTISKYKAKANCNSVHITMFNPNILKQMNSMPSDDRDSAESNTQFDSLLRGMSGSDRNTLSGAAASSNSSSTRGRHSSHLDSSGTLNATFNRNALSMHPYMVDNNHANIANVYAMQAQAAQAQAQVQAHSGLGGFHTPQQFPTGSQPAPNMDFQQQQQQAAMYHMIHASGAHGTNPFFPGLAGAMSFGNGNAMTNYEESAGRGQVPAPAIQSANSEEEEVEVPKSKRKKKESKKKRKKKPKDCPRRPLSGYNLFFKDERKRILDAIPVNEKDRKPKDPRDEITWPGKKRSPHGKIGFENLAKTIGARWKEIDEEQLKYYKDLATKDLHRYAREMKEYEAKLSSGKIKGPTDSESSSSEEEEVKPTKRKKTTKTKKRSNQNDLQDLNKAARPMPLDPYAVHQHSHPLHANAAPSNGFNFGPSEQDQLFHLRKLQQSMFGGISFNDGNPTNFFGESNGNTSPGPGQPNLSTVNGNSHDFDESSKKSLD